MYVANERQKDYSYYEKKSGNKYNRRLIDGSITGCGNCVGYCRYDEHPGFLTRKQRQEHNCIVNGCIYYVPKVKREKPREEVDARLQEVIEIASGFITGFEGLRIMDAARNENGGWLIKYITITNEHPVNSIENKISAAFGEEVTMVNLNYDFERAAQLILTRN